MPPMRSADTHREEADDLERLATELSPHSCKTVLVSGEDRPPSLDVIDPDAADHHTQRIHAQADYYWWPWAQPIAPRDQPATAAQIIVSTLTGTIHPQPR